MPNNVKITIKGKEEFLNQFRSDERIFDFEKIIPIPEELLNTIKGSGENDDPLRNRILIKKYGSANWYDWSVDNWGTKWNAYSEEEDEGERVFQTAWSPPEGIFNKLLEKFPNEEWEVIYQEEQGWGSHFKVIKGKLIEIEKWDIAGVDYLDEDHDIFLCTKSGGYGTTMKVEEGRYYSGEKEKEVGKP